MFHFLGFLSCHEVGIVYRVSNTNANDNPNQLKLTVLLV